MLLTSQFQSLSLTSTFPNGASASTSTSLLLKPATFALPPRRRLVILGMKTLQGKVICATNDKTVAVEVTRLAPHPKYKRRVRIKKKYHAHDELNQFKVGDIVQLEKGRPVSKTKTFWAIPAPPRPERKKPAAAADSDLGIPLESQSDTGAN